MKTIEILERVRIISPIVEPLYTRNWMNCAGWWISTNIWEWPDMDDISEMSLIVHPLMEDTCNESTAILLNDIEYQMLSRMIAF